MHVPCAQHTAHTRHTHRSTRTLQECVTRCAVDKYSNLMAIFLPSHGRIAMTMADATRAFIRNLLGLDGEEMSVYEVAILTMAAILTMR